MLAVMLKKTSKLIKIDTMNIFRFNCLIEDRNHSRLNSIILSLIAELIYDNYNQEINRYECFEYLIDYCKFHIEKNYYENLIDNCDFIIKTPSANDVSLKLTPEKFNEINNAISENSLEKYIDDFVSINGSAKTIGEAIAIILYDSIYNNISSFNPDNIKSIIPVELKHKFTKDEVEAFNNFIDWDNNKKNIAVFNVFLKAIEFSIFTSSKGIKEITKDIFKGKKYCLDTNIIFRLLGIGGEERKDSLLKVIKWCVYQGIDFEYSSHTFEEMKRRIQASVIEIKHAISQKNIEILEDSYNSDKHLFNEGFITNYIEQKKQNKVVSPEAFETNLITSFRLLENELNIKPIDKTIDIPQAKVEHLKNKLYEAKKEINQYSRYTQSAAEVDAFNLLYVRELRGNQTTSYSEIKSFYLTTDRTLNQILIKESGNDIVETLFPSQLFLIHSISYDESEGEDYKTFMRFLKRRTTEFKLTGREALSYIKQIRTYTNESVQIKEVLKAYTDLKYDTSLNMDYSEPKNISIQEFTETYLDRKLSAAELSKMKFDRIFSNALSEIPAYIKKSKTYTLIVDILITVIIVPLIPFVIGLLFNKLYLILILTVIFEVAKYWFVNNGNILKRLRLKIFSKSVFKSAFYKLTDNKKQFYETTLELYNNSERNIWKKDK
jgi:hypothetical protein